MVVKAKPVVTCGACGTPLLADAVARKAGVSRASVYRYARGVHVRPDTARRINAAATALRNARATERSEGGS